MDASILWFDKAITTLQSVYEFSPDEPKAREFLRNSYQCRALSKDKLGQPLADDDWEMTLALTPSNERRDTHHKHVISLLNSEQYERAIDLVDQIIDTEKWLPGQYYDFACVNSVGSTKISDRSPELEDRALELLELSAKTGYTNASWMSEDSDLKPLRDRDDYKRLIESIRSRQDP